MDDHMEERKPEAVRAGGKLIYRIARRGAWMGGLYGIGAVWAAEAYDFVGVLVSYAQRGSLNAYLSTLKFSGVLFFIITGISALMGVVAGTLIGGLDGLALALLQRGFAATPGGDRYFRWAAWGLVFSLTVALSTLGLFLLLNVLADIWQAWYMLIAIVAGGIAIAACRDVIQKGASP